jgi:hypothetical protein
LLFRLLSGPSGCFAGKVENDTALVAAAHGACPMRYLRRPALTILETLCFKRKVSPVLTGLAPVMSHPDDHDSTLAK